MKFSRHLDAEIVDFQVRAALLWRQGWLGLEGWLARRCGRMAPDGRGGGARTPPAPLLLEPCQHAMSPH
jgi:hypothetical protein